jgi:hypothetical protein
MVKLSSVLNQVLYGNESLNDLFMNWMMLDVSIAVL